MINMMVAVPDGGYSVCRIKANYTETFKSNNDKNNYTTRERTVVYKLEGSTVLPTVKVGNISHMNSDGTASVVFKKYSDNPLLIDITKWTGYLSSINSSVVSYFNTTKKYGIFPYYAKCDDGMPSIKAYSLRIDLNTRN